MFLVMSDQSRGNQQAKQTTRMENGKEFRRISQLDN